MKRKSKVGCFKPYLLCGQVSFTTCFKIQKVRRGDWNYDFPIYGVPVCLMTRYFLIFLITVILWVINSIVFIKTQNTQSNYKTCNQDKDFTSQSLKELRLVTIKMGKKFIFIFYIFFLLIE